MKSINEKLQNNEVITVAVNNSTNLNMYSYNPQTKIFSILFKRGTLYKYNNVEKEVVYKFLNATSIGQTFRKYILDKYTYTRYDNMGSEKYTVNV